METILIFFYIYMFVIGTCVASFINVVIYRLPLGISVAKGRSFCPSCQHQLKAIDLIPIVSYLCLGGKCRYCRSPIPMRDTILEFIGGMLGMLCFYRYGIHWMTLISFVFAMILVAITMIDFDTMTIPNSLVIACLVVCVLYYPFNHNSLWECLIGFFIVSGSMYLMNLIIPDCFGGGDIKLIAVCGLMLGWKLVLVGMFIAVIIAGCYAGYLMLTHKVDKKGHIAFGPYICFGMFVSLLYGNELLSWYLALFGL